MNLGINNYSVNPTFKAIRISLDGLDKADRKEVMRTGERIIDQFDVGRVRNNSDYVVLSHFDNSKDECAAARFLMKKGIDFQYSNKIEKESSKVQKFWAETGRLPSKAQNDKDRNRVDIELNRKLLGVSPKDIDIIPENMLEPDEIVERLTGITNDYAKA